VEQELLTLPDHMSSPTILSGVRVTWSLVLYVCFVNRCLSFCTFSFGHCAVCSSSIYGFGIPLWYLQTVLVISYFYYIPYWQYILFKVLFLQMPKTNQILQIKYWMENFGRSEAMARVRTEDVTRKNDSGYTIINTFTSIWSMWLLMLNCLQIILPL
jgi:hypothetical protein